jgi:hypothetical protein
MSDRDKPTFLGTAALKARGWSPGMIDSLLGEPDKLKKNPRYSTAAPMRLYLLDRVAVVEQSPAFVAARETAGKRSAAAKAAAAKRREASPPRVRLSEDDLRELELLAPSNRFAVTPSEVEGLHVQRDVLKRYIGKRSKWRATVGRFGTKGAILLLDVTNQETGSRFDHQWHPVDKGLGRMQPRDGDTIEFVAEPFAYEKGYRGTREALADWLPGPSIDLLLGDFSDVRLLDIEGLPIDLHAAPRAFQTKAGWFVGYRGVRAPAAGQAEAEAKAIEITAWMKAQGHLPAATVD